MPNKYNKPGLRSTEDQNGGHGVILCDVGPEDQGLPGRVCLKLNFLGLHYRLWSFNFRVTKLKRFSHKNQHTLKKIIEF